MQNAAVICEFDPFHNGHKYLFDTIREKYHADNIIAIMSGNYVQRGEPAMLDKYTRTKAALLCGADIVIEIPAVFSSSSADDFACAGISIAEKTGITDMLCFGYETCGRSDISEDDIRNMSNTLISLDNKPEFNEIIRAELKSGSTYPEAYAKAVSLFMDEKNKEKYSCLLSLSNNMLALSYMKYLRNTDIKPCFIERKGAGHSDPYIDHKTFSESISASSAMLSHSSVSGKDVRYISSSAIRKAYFGFEESFSDYIEAFTPSELHELYLFYPYTCLNSDSLSNILNYKLLSSTKDELCAYLDVSEEVAGRIFSIKEPSLGLSERINAVKTKQYTYLRISRAFLHIALGITKNESMELKNNGFCRYIRLLGFKRSSSELLSELKRSCSVPIISKPADHKDLLVRDVYFDNLYYSLSGGPSEYTRSPVII